MTPKCMSECLSLIEAMPSQQAWTAKHAQTYAVVLRNLEDGEAHAAVERALTVEEWRPAPARLLAIAAEIASPVPDAEASYAEIMHKAQTLGLHACPVPGRANCYTSGPPPMSHPLVSRIVAYLGGWEMVCTGEANMQEGLKKQVRGAHASVARQWTDDVRANLTLPPAERDPLLFRAYVPYALPTGYQPEVDSMQAPALPAPPRDEYALPAPPAIREMVGRIKSLADANGGWGERQPRTVSRGLPMTAAQRTAIEREVREKETSGR